MNTDIIFGLEHEFALVDAKGLRDFSNLTQLQLEAVIETLPRYNTDYPTLRVGDIGIKDKRWYIEGLERFNPDGSFAHITPRGIELRTPVMSTIIDTVETLKSDRELLRAALRKVKMDVIEVSFNPFLTRFEPVPPLNETEKTLYAITQSETAGIYMLTYGPDVNLSSPRWDEAQTIDLARKLTYYSPFITTFSLNAPFYGGKLWDGYSVRTYQRTGVRPAAVAYTSMAANKKHGNLVTHEARSPQEVGRIEYMAYDTPSSLDDYLALTALIKGVVLDDTLMGRADAPDASLHKLAAREAFDDERVYAGAHEVLNAAQTALQKDSDVAHLILFEKRLASRTTPAHALIARYNKTQNILLSLEDPYAKE